MDLQLLILKLFDTGLASDELGLKDLSDLFRLLLVVTLTSLATCRASFVEDTRADASVLSLDLPVSIGHFSELHLIVSNLVPQLIVFGSDIGQLPLQPIDLRLLVPLLLSELLPKLSHLLPEQVNLVLILLVGRLHLLHVLLSLLKHPLLSPDLVHLLFL